MESRDTVRSEDGHSSSVSACFHLELAKTSFCTDSKHAVQMTLGVIPLWEGGFRSILFPIWSRYVVL